MRSIVSIPGLHCSSCAAMIKDISSEFPEITNVDVDLVKKMVTIEHVDEFDLRVWKGEVESLGESYKILPSPSP